jgi:hypothetical protein
MFNGRRFKQTQSLKERLLSFAKDLSEQAAQLPAGIERDDMLRRARRADTAAQPRRLGELSRIAAARLRGARWRPFC